MPDLRFPQVLSVEEVIPCIRTAAEAVAEADTPPNPMKPLGISTTQGLHCTLRAKHNT